MCVGEKCVEMVGFALIPMNRNEQVPIDIGIRHGETIEFVGKSIMLGRAPMIMTTRG